MRMKEDHRLYGQMPGTVTADAGYGSEQNYQFLEENFIRAFVKNPYFDKDQHDKAKWVIASNKIDTSRRKSSLGWGPGI